MKIKNDTPKEAEPATPEERKRILDTLAKHVTPGRVLTLDGEQRRGQLNLPFGCKSEPK